MYIIISIYASATQLRAVPHPNHTPPLPPLAAGSTPNYDRSCDRHFCLECKSTLRVFESLPHMNPAWTPRHVVLSFASFVLHSKQRANDYEWCGARRHRSHCVGMAGRRVQATATSRTMMAWARMRHHGM